MIGVSHVGADVITDANARAADIASKAPGTRSVAAVPGRDVTANARLLAIVAMSMDEALIAVFDAKYAYDFWRPTTAIRSGDLDGNDATERDPSRTPFIDTPMHPETRAPTASCQRRSGPCSRPSA